MTADDPFVTYDAAYVLGALSPEDRQEFEEHLQGCARCASAVREVAGMPAVLSRTGPPPEPAGPPPDLLPDVLRRVRRGRRLRNAVSVVSASVAVAACIGFGVMATSSAAEPPTGTAMTALGQFPVHADARLDARDWGTQVDMSCSYTEPDGSSHDYVLVAVGRDGTVTRLATWLALSQNTARIVVGTTLRATDIRALEIRSGSGLPLLRLST